MTHTTRITDVEYDEIIHETDKAMLFSIEGKKVWLPKAAIEVDEDAKMITLPEGMAIDKELV